MTSYELLRYRERYEDILNFYADEYDTHSSELAYLKLTLLYLGVIGYD